MKGLRGAVATSQRGGGTDPVQARFAAMSQKNPPEPLPSNAEKDPHEWTTGGETMTGAQASYLDPFAKIPEFKFCAARVSAAGAMPAAAAAE